MINQGWSLKNGLSIVNPLIGFLVWNTNELENWHYFAIGLWFGSISSSLM
jgi:hypothetical protein